MRKVLIAPSILACNCENLIESVESINGYADFLHFDVMDGKFVPPTSFDEKLLDELHKYHSLVNDVHLMVVNPDELIDKYANSHADIITVHYEAFDSDEKLIECLNHIKNHGIKAGLSIKPNTKVEAIFKFLPLIDLILVMSVEPGYGGQKFMLEAVDKISTLRKYIDENNLKTLIEVDGGIKEDTARLVKDAGIDVIVSGTFLFGHKDILKRIEILRS
ncbi:MAG: ribulose-phosphate 3-epimerase [Bacilli bacterium]|nr:ribulose-phosphate 3-epimerase [Bacilli bacterium]